MRSFLSPEIEESRSCRVNERAREKKRERIEERELFLYISKHSQIIHTITY